MKFIFLFLILAGCTDEPSHEQQYKNMIYNCMSSCAKGMQSFDEYKGCVCK